MPTGLRGIHANPIHHPPVSASEHAIQLFSIDFAEMKNTDVAGALVSVISL